MGATTLDRVRYVKLENTDIVDTEIEYDEFGNELPHNCDYFPMIDILTHYVDKTKAKEIRTETFRAVKDIMLKLKVTDFKGFWELNVKQFDEKINVFMTVPQIRVYAPLIEVIENRRIPKGHKDKKRDLKEMNTYISFGIKKQVLIDYAKDKEVKEIAKVGRPKETKTVKYGMYRFRIVPGDNSSRVYAPRTPTLEMWRDWCKLNQIPQRDAILQAMQVQIDDNPTENLPPLESYTKQFPVDMADIEPLTQNNRKNIMIDKNVDEISKQIIKNYNIVNFNQHLTYSEYVSNAIDLLNKQLYSKYFDLTKEQKDENLKMYQDYMNKINENSK